MQTMLYDTIQCNPRRCAPQNKFPSKRIFPSCAHKKAGCIFCPCCAHQWIFLGSGLEKLRSLFVSNNYFLLICAELCEDEAQHIIPCDALLSTPKSCWKSNCTCSNSKWSRGFNCFIFLFMWFAAQRGWIQGLTVTVGAVRPWIQGSMEPLVSATNLYENWPKSPNS